MCDAISTQETQLTRLARLSRNVTTVTKLIIVAVITYLLRPWQSESARFMKSASKSLKLNSLPPTGVHNVVHNGCLLWVCIINTVETVHRNLTCTCLPYCNRGALSQSETMRSDTSDDLSHI